MMSGYEDTIEASVHVTKPRKGARGSATSMCNIHFDVRGGDAQVCMH